MHLLVVAIIVALVCVFKLKGRPIPGLTCTPFLFVIKNKKRIHDAILQYVEQTQARFLGITVGLTKMIFVTHPDTIKEVLQSEKVGMFSQILSPMAHKLGSGSLFYQNYGDEWRHQRMVVSQSFHYDNIKSMTPIIQKNTATLLKTLENFDEVNIRKFAHKLAIENLGGVIFGSEFNLLSGNSEMNEFVREYEKFMEYNTSIKWRMFAFILEKLPTKTREEYARLIEKMSELTKKLLNKKLAEAKGDQSEGLLSQMASKFSPQAAAGNTFMFFVAGHETTARALSWAFYYLGKYPNIQAKVFENILNHSSGENFDFHSMAYLDMFVKEVFRLRPPAGQAPLRVAADDITIAGQFIPKSTPVVISIYSVHHLSEFWPNPEEFDPERFSPENSQNRHPYAYLPFSLGRRACVGSVLSIFEVKIAIVMFLRKYKISLSREVEFAPTIWGVVPDSVNIKLMKRN